MKTSPRVPTATSTTALALHAAEQLIEVQAVALALTEVLVHRQAVRRSLEKRPHTTTEFAVLVAEDEVLRARQDSLLSQLELRLPPEGTPLGI